MSKNNSVVTLTYPKELHSSLKKIQLYREEVSKNKPTINDLLIEAVEEFVSKNNVSFYSNAGE